MPKWLPPLTERECNSERSRWPSACSPCTGSATKHPVLGVCCSCPSLRTVLSLTPSSPTVLLGTCLLPVCYGLALVTGSHRARTHTCEVLVGGVSCAEWTEKGIVLRRSPVLTHFPARVCHLLIFRDSAGQSAFLIALLRRPVLQLQSR